MAGAWGTLSSIRATGDKRPEWAIHQEEEAGPRKTFVPVAPSRSGFLKPAVPKGFKLEAGLADPGKVDEREKSEPAGSFAKAAKPPSRRNAVIPDVPTVTVGGRAKPRSMGEKESKDLARYLEISLRIFSRLRLMGIEMDLLDLVKKEDGSINEDRFSILTSPNKASTGLRYARPGTTMC